MIRYKDVVDQASRPRVLHAAHDLADGRVRSHQCRFVLGGVRTESVADFIDRGIQNRRKEEVLIGISHEVAEFCEKFPLYPERERKAEEKKAPVS